MKLVGLLLILILVFLCITTYYYWKKHEKMIHTRNVQVPKYELVEVSPDDKKYDEYYEPKIIEIISSDEYL